MQALASDRDIRLDLEGELEGAWDRAGSVRFFSNLIGNAIQYSSSGSVISVAVAGDHNHAVLPVHNDSPIPVVTRNRSLIGP